MDWAKKILLLTVFPFILWLRPLRQGLFLLLGGLLAGALLQRPICALERRSIPRWLTAGLLLLLFVATGAAILLTGLQQLCRLGSEAVTYCSQGTALLQRSMQLAKMLPGGVSSLMLQLLDWLQTGSSTVSTQLAETLTTWGTDMLSTLPGQLFRLGILLLAAFYSAVDYPHLRPELSGLIPQSWRHGLTKTLHSLRQGALRWLLAQGRMMCIQFILLCVGLGLLGVSWFPLPALLISFVDALPLFGSGIVLLPWALFVWLAGAGWRSLWFCALWLCLCLTRSILEPRLVGKQVGVPPLYTLIALFIGVQWFGAAGFFLAPVALAALRQLFSSSQEAK